MSNWFTKTIQKVITSNIFNKTVIRGVNKCYLYSQMFSVPFEEVASEDVWVTLKKLLESGMDQRKQVAKEYIHVFDLNTQEVRKRFF